MLIFFRTILKYLAFSWDFGTEYVIFSISVKINSSIGCADLSRYGLEINEEKSNWEPERKFSWIGYNIHTQTGPIFACE